MSTKQQKPVPHLSQLIFERAKKYGKRAALYYRDDSAAKWIPISWNDLALKVKLMGKALISLGIQPTDKIGIFSQNMYQHIVADFANFTAKAVSIPMYATSTAEQIEYMVNDAEISTIFVGEKYQYETTLKVLKSSEYLKHIIVFDNSIDISACPQAIYFDTLLTKSFGTDVDKEFEKRMSMCSENDMMSILYTSGTTGQPKGVMLHQSNYTECLRIHAIRLTTMTDKDTSMAFLPLTHVFERGWTYVCFHVGTTIYINHLPNEIQERVTEVRPTLMCAVPRYWEKVYAAVNAKIESSPRFMRRFFRWAIEVGREYNLTYKQKGKHVPAGIATKYKLFAKPLFNKVKVAAGIDHGKFFPCAGAKLADEINEFFHAIGVNICYGYGLTESTATVCCFPPENKNYVIGSIGKIMPDLGVKISSDGEILLKGKTITEGYFKRPDANKEAFTEDGWFRTGDSGYIDMNNNLYITDRIKDLFKTAGGKYIAPQMLENLVSDSRYVEQSVAIGNERKYVSMLIVPSFHDLKEWATAKGLKWETKEELIALPEVVAMYQDMIDKRNAGLARYEQIKRFTLLPNVFTMEQGHLTNTLKIKRKVINELFAKEINAMYPVE